MEQTKVCVCVCIVGHKAWVCSVKGAKLPWMILTKMHGIDSTAPCHFSVLSMKFWCTKSSKGTQ